MLLKLPTELLIYISTSLFLESEDGISSLALTSLRFGALIRDMRQDWRRLYQWYFAEDYVLKGFAKVTTQPPNLGALIRARNDHFFTKTISDKSELINYKTSSKLFSAFSEWFSAAYSGDEEKFFNALATLEQLGGPEFLSTLDNFLQFHNKDHHTIFQVLTPHQGPQWPNDSGQAKILKRLYIRHLQQTAQPHEKSHLIFLQIMHQQISASDLKTTMAQNSHLTDMAINLALQRNDQQTLAVLYQYADLTFDSISVKLLASSPTQQILIIKAVGARWKDLTRDVYDFSFLILELPLTQAAIYYEELKPFFAYIIITDRDFCKLLVSLKNELRQFAIAAVKPILSTLKRISPYDIIGTLYFLNAEERQTLFFSDEMRSTLPLYVSNIGVYESIMIIITPEQNIILFEAMLTHFQNIIKFASDFHHLFPLLSPHQIQLVLIEMQPHFPSIFTMLYSYKLAFPHYGSDDSLFNLTVDILIGVIHSAQDFEEATREIQNNKNTDIVFSALLTRLNDYIKTAKDFSLFTSHLSQAQIKIVFEAIKPNLNSFVNSLNGYCYARTFSREYVYRDKFYTIFHHLPLELGHVACQELKKSLIQSALPLEYFPRLYQRIYCERSPQHAEIVCQNLADVVGPLLNTPKDIATFLRNLTPKLCHLGCNTMQTDLIRIIKTASDLATLLKPLSPAQCGHICKTLANQLNHIVKNDSEANLVLFNLSKNQRTAISPYVHTSQRRLDQEANSTTLNIGI